MLPGKLIPNPTNYLQCQPILTACNILTLGWYQESCQKDSQTKTITDDHTSIRSKILLSVSTTRYITTTAQLYLCRSLHTKHVSRKTICIFCRALWQWYSRPNQD